MNIDLWTELGFNNVIYDHQHDIVSITQKVSENLHDLLNARCRWNVDEQHLSSSQVLGYGLPDLFNFNPGVDGQCTKLCQTLRAYISRYEPRLYNIEVELMPLRENDSSQLHFKIFGFLDAFNNVRAIEFETILNFNKLRFHLRQGVS